MLRQLAGQIPGGVKWGSNGEGTVHCPFHKDKTASCSINTKKETFFCHSCGEKGTLQKLLIHCGITVPDAPSSGLAQAITYDYCNDKGELIYQVVRTETIAGKTFKQRRPDGAGGWLWKLGKIKRLPYQLSDLLKALAFAEPVLIVEGEKCVEALHTWGFNATCNSGGAGKWRPELNSHFPKGAKVYLLPDADKPGIAHMQKVGKYLLQRGCNVCWAYLGYPVEEKHGKDIANWIPSHSPQELKELIAAAPAFVPVEEETPAEEKKHSPADSGAQSIDFTDVANAERFFREWGEKVRYCTAAKAWLHWSGKVWAEDDNQVIASWAKKTARRLYEQAWQTDNAEVARKAIACKSRSKIESMLALAKSEGNIPVRQSELDTDPWLFNCANGTLDLRHVGLLRPHEQKNLITKISPVSFDENEQCPHWENFLLQIMAGDAEMVCFLRRMAGYCLTGDMRERKYFTLYGIGNNGKSVFIETLMAVLGDYAATALRDTFLRNKSEGIQHDIARLRGARMVCVSETGKGSYLDEELVKQWVGQDTLSGRFLYARNAFDFRPVGKLIIRTNYRPSIKGQDEGIWGRSIFVEFPERFEGKREDKELKDKLLSELPAIFHWCLVGCGEWQAGGLDPPEKIKAAGESYREEQDDLAEFFSEYCVINPSAKIDSVRLFELYQQWCEKAGVKKALNRVWFGRTLTDRGFQRDRNSGDRKRIGIGEK